MILWENASRLVRWRNDEGEEGDAEEHRRLLPSAGTRTGTETHTSSIRAASAQALGTRLVAMMRLGGRAYGAWMSA